MASSVLHNKSWILQLCALVAETVSSVQSVVDASVGRVIVQEDSGDESSSSMAADEEPYLRNNPAFEAYLDSDTSSTGSIESDSCTTPRSAIQEQVPSCNFAG